MVTKQFGVLVDYGFLYKNICSLVFHERNGEDNLRNEMQGTPGLKFPSLK